MDDYEYCNECQALGDDYYVDADGEWVWACDGCPFNEIEARME